MGYCANGGGCVMPKNDTKIPDVLICKLANTFTEVVDSPDGGIWMTYEYDKYHDDDMQELMQELAPHIQSGNVEFHGEDETHWRYFFSNGEVQYQQGRIVYEPINKEEH